MTRPLIAVPAMWSGQVRGLRFSGSTVATAVLEAIALAGGDPVAVHPGHVSKLGPGDPFWSRFDGLVLPGGSDIDPRRYGQEPDARFAGCDWEGQDEADARAIAAALDAGLPALLICRGMQMLNVVRGGTLSQHWQGDGPEHVGEVHEVAVAPGSLLAEALGGAARVDVSSYHHQAADAIGAGLVVSATADDGCVEALELDEAPLLAVQWHPEDRAAHVDSDLALFRWVVERAAERARLQNEGAAS